MKHFIVDITYTAPAEHIAEVRPDHRAFLQTGYDKGWLLCSGPKGGVPGGVVVVRAPTAADIEQFFAADPYHVQGVATHTFIEFDPVMRQSWFEDWATGA
jgi:uncharacterized protein YciI